MMMEFCSSLIDDIISYWIWPKHQDCREIERGEREREREGERGREREREEERERDGGREDKEGGERGGGK